MSEEEIIKYLKGYKYDNEVNQAIQGLLDLYNKEKEKNKELENADLTTVYMNGFYDGEKKWKDKIKEKVIKVKNRTVKDDFITATQGKLNTIIDLEELLGG